MASEARRWVIITSFQKESVFHSPFIYDTVVLCVDGKFSIAIDACCLR